MMPSHLKPKHVALLFLNTTAVLIDSKIHLYLTGSSYTNSTVWYINIPTCPKIYYTHHRSQRNVRRFGQISQNTGIFAFTSIRTSCLIQRNVRRRIPGGDPPRHTPSVTQPLLATYYDNANVTTTKPLHYRRKKYSYIFRQMKLVLALSPPEKSWPQRRREGTNVNGTLWPVIEFFTSTEISCVNCIHRSGGLCNTETMCFLFVCIIQM